VHQHRAVYELCGTEYADFAHEEIDVALRDRIMGLDNEMLGECAGLYSISKTVSHRLQQYNGMDSTPLYHPPLLANRLTSGEYGSYILSVARLEQNKRVDLVVRAMAHLPSHLRLVIVSEGSRRAFIERTAEEAGVADRVDFAGAVDDEQLIELYRDALALVYVPYDEDYGLATLEAFLAERPVVTATDSGGTLEFVSDGVTGRVVEPTADAIAGAVAALDADRLMARSMGRSGLELARGITWDAVIERLVQHG
jgi:glycosyltransferase involved in cell wall biosynthesis